MPSLLSIPRELRDQILGYIILAREEAPALDQSFAELTRYRTNLHNPKLRSWCTVVPYRKEDAPANATNLLLVNRQIHAETLENVKLLDARVYDLDVIILNEIVPVPTWTHVPLLTTSLDKINVAFRISGRFDPTRSLNDGRLEGSEGWYKPRGRYKGFRGGDGAGPAMGWQIYAILERFIKAGTRGEMDDEKEHNRMTVKTIDINIETPPDVDPSLFAGPSCYRRRHSDDDLETSVLDPEYLVDFINRDISALMHGDHEWFQYGKILFEHVDTVVVRRNGVEMHKYDVAESLGAAGGFKEKYISEEMLKEYKTATWEKRRERGLKVLGD
jgi:hypothetical protein